mgnify:CR=1 FL=1
MVDTTKAEERVKEYYFKQQKIEQLEYTLKGLYRRKEEVTERIDKSRIKLEDDFSAVNYDGVGGSGSITSPQDRAIEKAFRRLEKSFEDTVGMIIEVEEEISYLKQNNREIEYIINGMKQEYRKILEGFYKYNKSTLQMTFDMNMSKNTIYRKKEQILEQIARWFGYCG